MSRPAVPPPILTYTVCAIAALSAALAAQTTERISVSSAGAQGNASSLHESSVSPDGRYVAFQSEATNLVTGDTNGERDIFVRDRLFGATTRVSVSSAGAEANGSSFRPSISADGRFVAFESWASNLVTGDTNGFPDVFLHDRVTGATTRRSVSSAGAQGDRGSYSPALSANGQWLAFTSQASTLVPLVNNFVGHVFLHHCASGVTTLASTGPAGTLENGASDEASLSADGRFMEFISDSTDLIPSGSSGSYDVYVRDRLTGSLVRASAPFSGVAANGASRYATISADGRSVAFQSSASNLVPGDTNFLTDVFVRDLKLGVTERVSVSSTGVEANGGSDATGQPPGISADGRYVAFSSYANNLAPGWVGWQVIYLRDRAAGTTSMISVSNGGIAANNSSYSPVMSADGSTVAFQSQADNLVASDTNGVFDMFVRGSLPTVWTNLGSGLAGVTGVPNLIGSGTLLPGSPGKLLLNGARPSAAAPLFVAFSSTPLAVLCGTLIASPATALITLTTDPAGVIDLPWTSWPGGPGLSGQKLYLQYLIADPVAPCGVAFSNAVRGNIP